MRPLPHIEADLIRLSTRLESAADRYSQSQALGAPQTAKQLQADVDLIEEARLVVRQATRNAAGQARAPLNLWTGTCFGVGAISAGAAMLFGFPLSLSITGGVLVLSGVAILIDRKHL